MTASTPVLAQPGRVATVERSPLNGKSSAFSYRGIGVHYPAEYTIRQLNESKKKLLEHLGRFRPEQKEIPVSFSLGGAITLLAFQEWLGDGESLDRLSRVPALIFIGPAHAPALGLYKGYEEKLNRMEINEIPPPVRELCRSEKSPLRIKAAAALSELSNKTKVYVLYSSSDLLTPFRPADFPNVRSRPVDLTLAEPLPLEAVKWHTALISAELRNALTAVLVDIVPLSSSWMLFGQWH